MYVCTYVAEEAQYWLVSNPDPPWRFETKYWSKYAKCAAVRWLTLYSIQACLLMGDMLVCVLTRTKAMVIVRVGQTVHLVPKGHVSGCKRS